MDTNINKIAREQARKEKKSTKNNISKVLTLIKEKSGVKLSKNKLRMIQETIRAIATSRDKKEASIVLGISEQAFYNRLRSYPQIKEGVQALKDITIESTRDRIVFTAPRLADNTISLADHAQSENVKLQANLELLAIAGIQKQAQGNVQVNILNNIQKDKEAYK